VIKLYILYLVLGLYLLFESYSVWIFSAFSGGDNIITYLALTSSTTLFLGASIWSLYSVKNASILGLAALVGVFPFSLHWLLYRFEFEAPITRGTYNQVVLGATVLYIIAVFYSIKYIVSDDKHDSLNKKIKVGLIFLPILVSLIIVILSVWNP